MVGVHLGAAFGPAKVWVRERIVEFGRLAPSLGMMPVLLGAPSDEPAAAAVLDAAPMASLVGRDSPGSALGGPGGDRPPWCAATRASRIWPPRSAPRSSPSSGRPIRR